MNPVTKFSAIKDHLTLDGKFFNTDNATLIALSEWYSSYGTKRHAFYQSKTGRFFKTIQTAAINTVSHNLESYKAIPTTINLKEEKIDKEFTEAEFVALFEKMQRNEDYVLDSGPYCHCILRNRQPVSPLKIVGQPSLPEVEEV
ncbi:hypothetical protein [Vibrio crassostreae]|uniref:hypothetical protein n=1 Tax=Vibrio crassostreae TaxID=246167 RepID=UPI001B30EFCB|nr:hypothetical protein [Vibrio crassostreae]